MEFKLFSTEKIKFFPNQKPGSIVFFNQANFVSIGKNIFLMKKKCLCTMKNLYYFQISFFYLILILFFFSLFVFIYLLFFVFIYFLFIVFIYIISKKKTH